jgi:hypothetical protein
MPISICGERYYVGNPKAFIIMPRQAPIRCDDLEALVVNSLALPIGYLPNQVLIKKACECRLYTIHMDDAALDGKIQNSSTAIQGTVFQQTRNPSVSFHRNPPDFVTPSISPISRNLQLHPSYHFPHYGPFYSPIWDPPTSFPTFSPTNNPQPSTSFLTYFPFVGMGLFFLFFFGCGIGLYLRGNKPVQVNAPVPSAPSEDTIVNPSIEQESIETLRARRKLVVEILFPNQGNDSRVRYFSISFPFLSVIFRSDRFKISSKLFLDG